MPKLLIVDDETDVREFARNFFRKRAVEVHTASSGRDALSIITAEHPDLVLLDVRMEEMSGIEVLRELQRNQVSVKVIMVSGLEDEKIVQDARALGALSFIHKPLILEELEKVVMGEFKSTVNGQQSTVDNR